MNCAYCDISSAFDEELESKVSNHEPTRPPVMDDTQNFVIPNNNFQTTNPYIASPPKKNELTNNNTTNTTCNHIDKCPMCKKFMKKLIYLSRKRNKQNELITNAILVIIMILLIILLFK